jgi:hypothetical protein
MDTRRRQPPFRRTGHLRKLVISHLLPQVLRRSGAERVPFNLLGFGQILVLTELIESGRIQEAILLAAKEFPSLRDSDGKGTPTLEYFKLLCQQFVELIRDKRPNEALEFAESHLAHQAANSSLFAVELQVKILNFAYLTL